MTETEPTAPLPSLGVLLFIPYRYMEERIRAVVNAGGHDISSAQSKIFQRIDPQGSRLTDLAAAAQASKQATGFLVTELERSGYVERVADPSDRRARLIRMTGRGREVIAIAQVEQDRIEAEWEAHLGRDRMQEMYSTLADLRTITDPWQ